MSRTWNDERGRPISTVASEADTLAVTNVTFAASFTGLRVGHRFPERNPIVHDVLFLAMITPVRPHVSARHREFLYPGHLFTAFGALRQRWCRCGFASVA